LLLLIGNSQAITVSGTLSSGRWTIADSPVIVTGDLLLPAGQRLDIDPGVRIEFVGQVGFTVHGLLNAAGQRGSRIVFTSAIPNTDTVDTPMFDTDVFDYGNDHIAGTNDADGSEGDGKFETGDGWYGEDVGTDGIYAPNVGDIAYMWVLRQPGSVLTRIDTLYVGPDVDGSENDGVLQASEDQLLRPASIASSRRNGRLDSPDGFIESRYARWKGIRLIEADRACLFSFVRIENAYAHGAWPLNCGGGVYIERCSPTITNSELAYNQADGDGGAVYTWFSTALIQNTVILGNRAGDFGGGLFTAYSSPYLTNCTVAFDTAGGWGGGLYAGAEAKPIITNTILNYNINELWKGTLPDGGNFTANFGRAQSARPEVSYSNIAMTPLNVFPGAGNISIDPEFLSNVPPYDLHLKTSSPCVDAGDPKNSASAEPDRLVNRIDIGAYGGTAEAAYSLPVISSSPANLDWDAVRLEAQVSREVRITNKGHYRLYIRDFVFSSPDFFPDSVEGENGLIPSYMEAPIEPGEQGKYTVFCRPSAIVEYHETLTIVSTDTVTPNPRINLLAAGIEPVGSLVDSLDFGRVQIGAVQSVRIYVKNSGRSALTVQLGGIQGDGFDVNVVEETVAPNDSGLVRVLFRPTRPEVFEGKVTFATNENGNNLYLNLRGRGYGPKSEMADSALFMGYVYFQGDTAVAQLSVKNTGDEALNITGGRVGDATAFSFVLPNGVVSVPPDSTGHVTVRFHPNVAGRNYASNLILTSNYPIPDTVVVSGRGMAEPGRYVFGHVSGVWTWEPGSRDYVVLDSVYIPANERLKIEAGARILFRPGAFLQADGELRAIGQATDSIWFLPTADVSINDTNRWKGIYLNREDASKFSYCVISGSKNGVRIEEASPNFQFSTITDNGDAVGVETGLGGGFYIENSGAVINGCVISDNSAANGGGLYIINAKPTITNCKIINNWATDGGGLYMKFLSGGLFQSNLVTGNTATAGCGGMVLTDRCAPRVLNCTFSLNSASGVDVRVRSLPTLINCILWGNGVSSITLSGGGNALVTYCDVQGGFGSNLDVYPEFVGSGVTPYALLDASPVIDKGNPEASFRDYYFPPSKGTSRSDMGAYGGPLGGAWEVSDVSIALVQNSAYPRWLNVVITGLDMFTAAPSCSLQYPGGAMTTIALSRIDDYSYRGAFEARSEGSLFLTANAALSSGSSFKVGRTFDLHFITTGEGGFYAIPGVGELETAPGAVESNQVVMVSTELGAAKPADDMTPVSAIFEISGLNLKDGATATLRDVTTQLALSDAERNRLALYTATSGGGWQKVEDLSISGSGRYILALTDQPTNGGSVTQPVEHLLISAFPNPFNGAVSISFDMPDFGSARLAVYNLSGQKMDEWQFSDLSAGTKSITWEATSRDGSPLPSGVYWANIEAGGQRRAVKLLLVR